MTFHIPNDSSRQALSDPAKGEHKYLFSGFTLRGKFLTFLQIRPISKFFTGSDSPDRSDYKNV